MTVYHWTTEENAAKILKEGLRPFSFVCKNKNDWQGEVCLEIDYDVDWSDRDPDAMWQAIVKEYIAPERIQP